MKIFHQIIIAIIIVLAYLIGLRPILEMSFGGWSCGDFFCDTAILSAAGGVLGGAMYMTRGFYQAVMGTPKPFNFKKFFWWYLFRPVLSGACGLIGFLLVYLAFDLQETFKNVVAFTLGGTLIGFNLSLFIDHRIKAIGKAAVRKNPAHPSK